MSELLGIPKTIRNLHSEFAGTEEIYRLHFETLANFRNWKAAKSWNSYHSNHFDWWMFPYDQPSSYGFKYTIYEYEVDQLSRMDNFLANHAEGAALLLESWGWDSVENHLIENVSAGQSWANWPIRLFKCAKSLQQFNQVKHFESCMLYAEHLYVYGSSFSWSSNRDLYAELVNGI